MRRSGPVRPAPTRRTTGASPRRRHVAGGARIAVAGIAVSGMFGLTAVLATANRPTTPSKRASPAATARGSGGPADTEMAMTLTTLRDELPTLEFTHAHELDREIIEGQGHTGVGSVVQLIARKPSQRSIDRRTRNPIRWF